MNLKVLLALLSIAYVGGLICFGQNTHEVSTNDWQTKVITSKADLDRVIAQLQAPATRFDAFLALLDFAGYPRGNTYSHDIKVNALHEKAINAMRACPGLDVVIATMIGRLKKPDDRIPALRDLLKFSEPYQMSVFNGGTGNRSFDNLLAKINLAVNGAFDPPTVRAALTNSDWILRLTAVDHFGNSPAGVSEWDSMLPQIETMAVDDDASIRAAADRKLQGFPETGKFLDERLTNETSPDVILDLLRDRYVVGKELSNRFLSLFVPLLSNPDEKVRDDALIFVGFNSQRAPMLQFAFGMDVFDRVLAATQSNSAGERAAAADALTDIRQLDSVRSRNAFLRMTNDPDEDVRWHVAWGLNNQLERDDVKRAVAILLKDESPEVRYMTILAVGPQKFIAELQELSQGPDPRIAESARETLKQLAVEKRK